MTRNLIEIPQLTDDGRLYHHALLDTVEALIPNAPYRSCHAADLLELENGDLLCCWFAGSREGNADISIAVARLPADAEQWEQPVIVSDDPTRSEQNPSLFQNPNGDIWLMYTAQAAKFPVMGAAHGAPRRLCLPVPALSAARRFRCFPTGVGSSTTLSVRWTVPVWAAT